MIQGVLFGQEMAKLAADKAGSEWKKQALQAFLEHAMRHDEFTTEDVRLAHPNLPPPPDNRAWGYVASQAKRMGRIERVGYQPSISKHVHGTTVSLWKAKK